MTTPDLSAIADPLVREQLAALPACDRFATVDELRAGVARLAADHPAVARLETIGRSRLGEPIERLVIAGGRRDAVVVGLPHPGEPFGGLTALQLAQRLCADAGLRDALGFTWHVVPCADPDGARLNEGWFAGPMTPSRYARGFYRPALDEQVEWTFPLEGDGDPALPEARALKALLDETRPALQCSLHNSEGGGIYYYLSHAHERLQAALPLLPAALGLPLHAGEPEAPGVRSLAPAVYLLPSGAELREMIAAAGLLDSWPGGTCSHDYAERHGTLTVVCEVPYWIDPGSHDETPTDEPYAALLRRHAERLERPLAEIGGTLDAIAQTARVDSPFLRAARDFRSQLGGLPAAQRERAEAIPAERTATAAERWSCEHELRMIQLVVGGMLLRALDAELAAGNVAASVRAARAEHAARFDRWAADADAAMPSRPAPIERLVAAQLATVLTAARALADD